MKNYYYNSVYIYSTVFNVDVEESYLHAAPNIGELQQPVSGETKWMNGVVERASQDQQDSYVY